MYHIYIILIALTFFVPLFSSPIDFLFNITPPYKSPSDHPSDSVRMDVSLKRKNPQNRDSWGHYGVSVTFRTVDFIDLKLKGNEKVFVKLISEDDTVILNTQTLKTRGINEPTVYYYAKFPTLHKTIKKIEVVYVNKRKEKFISYITYPNEPITIIAPQNNDTLSIIRDTICVAWKSIAPTEITVGGSDFKDFKFTKKNNTIDNCNKILIYPKQLQVSPTYTLIDSFCLKGRIWILWQLEGDTDKRLSQKSLFYDEFAITLYPIFTNKK